jgi:cytochrome c oxidase subunit II
VHPRSRARWAGAAAALLAAAVPALAGDPLGLLPESASAEADRIDHLVYLILWVTGITFVGVQAALVWFLFRYRRREGVRAKHTHGNHTVEMVWTVAPAAILVFLAVYQMGLWAEVKSSKPDDNANAVPVRIFARTFEWNFRYPGLDGKWDTEDDTTTLKALVVPVDRPVNAELRSMDVLHSFFLPNLRFKQDAVPGLHTQIWFRANKLSADRSPIRSSTGALVKLPFFDIVCAELCGNGHTTMAGELYVVTQAQYDAWTRGEDVTVAPGVTLPKPRPAARLASPYDFVWSRWYEQDDPVVKGPAPWVKKPFAEDFTGASDEETEEE